MSAELERRSPRTGAPLREEAGALVAAGERFPVAEGIADLRVEPRAVAPAPLHADELERCLERLRAGASFKEALERLLLELPLERAERAMLVLRESRGAWLPLCRGGPGRALFLGNALSGCVSALAALGHEVHVLEPSRARLELARLRCERERRVRIQVHVGGDGPRLPFADGSFDLVVQDGGLPGAATGWGHDLAECRRVARGELALVADNRFAYKRSGGEHGVFRLARPLELLRSVLRPRRGERGLAGYRRALAATGAHDARAFALYPHSLDFTWVVALDAPAPRLHVGPKERANRWKTAGKALGLFPLLTPSFAIVAARGALAGRPARVERLLAALAERIGEPAPRVDEWIATRGNSAVVQTTREGAAEGAWTVHLPLSATRRAQLGRHAARTRRLVAERPGLPVPEPLFEGELESAWVLVERRLGGRTAPEVSGSPARMRAVLESVAAVLAGLVEPGGPPLDEEAFERLLGRRFALSARYAARPQTSARLERMRARARELALGRVLPRALMHGDLRPKHVQVDADGRVLGLLDWGCSEDPGLPYFDLLHFVVHERRQEGGLDAAASWRLLSEPGGLRAHERGLLDGYARAAGLDADLQRLLEDSFPALVGAMAEGNWDYSRPRWLHRQFGV